jgi:hypothetical protein
MKSKDQTLRSKSKIFFLSFRLEVQLQAVKQKRKKLSQGSKRLNPDFHRKQILLGKIKLSSLSLIFPFYKISEGIGATEPFPKQKEVKPI